MHPVLALGSLSSVTINKASSSTSTDEMVCFLCRQARKTELRLSDQDRQDIASELSDEQRSAHFLYWYDACRKACIGAPKTDAKQKMCRTCFKRRLNGILDLRQLVKFSATRLLLQASLNMAMTPRQPLVLRMYLNMSVYYVKWEGLEVLNHLEIEQAISKPTVHIQYQRNYEIHPPLILAALRPIALLGQCAIYQVTMNSAGKIKYTQVAILVL